MRPLISKRPTLLLAALVVGVTGVGCQAPVAPAPPAPPDAIAKKVAASRTKAPANGTLKRVTKENTVAVATTPAQLAEQLCSAALKTPHTLAARCCKRRSTKVDVTACTAALTPALAAKRIAAAGVSRCFFDLEEALEGCDWVGSTPPLPLSCRGVIQSRQGAGAPCQHAIECESGNCVESKCAARGNADVCSSIVGGFAANACAAGQRCAGERCVPACQPPCHAGERCSEGSCSVQKAPGQPCDDDSECVGACFEGLCAMRCNGIGDGAR